MISPEGYDSWVQNLLPGSGIFDERPGCVLVLLDGTSLIAGKSDGEVIDYLENMLGLIRSVIETHRDITFMVSTLDICFKKILPHTSERIERRAASYWNEQIRDVGCIVFELEELIKEYGREKMYDPKLWYLGSIPYSFFGEEKIATEIQQLLNAYTGKRKKTLVLDLDNTLWGGVVGEEGLNGISLAFEKEGKQYRDFQSGILDLKQMGVMLAVVSKNNEEDALEVFRNHPAMILKETDFVSMKVNWEPKAKNIANLAQELNVGLDSFVFIDDSPFEREAVLQLLPEVCVPDFPKDSARLPGWIRKIASEHFLFLETTEEDGQRTQMMRADISRKNLQAEFTDIDSYLSSLRMVLDIHLATPEDHRRIAQLTQKTNQFNVTTRRYTEADIVRMTKDPNYRIWVGGVNDRYGDYGKVVVFICRLDGTAAQIDTFLMSCRVMERAIEDAAIDWVEGQLRSEGIEEIRTEYLPTPKNKPVQFLWERLGYIPEENPGQYTRMLSDPLPESASRKTLVTVNPRSEP
jgi:FkbH-like protein